MVCFAVFSSLTFALFAFALPSPLSPDPSGNKNIGNGQGLQFITGACLSNADCASGCCATLNGAGIYSGIAVANQQGKQGCGFGGSNAEAPASTPSAEPPASGDSSSGDSTSGSGEVNTSAPGSQNVGKGNGQQFITGQCFSDADCASGCCAGLQGTGTCSAEAVANANGKTGCGFVQQ